MPYILDSPLYYSLEICSVELFQFYAYLHQVSLIISHQYDYIASEDISNVDGHQD
jgi:hypothetical protein